MVRPHDECYDEKGQPGVGTVTVTVPVDPTPYTLGADPGSRPWMLMRALEGGGDGRAEKAAKGAEGGEGADAVSAEDRFHLRAKPKGGYDPVTGLQSREEEPVEEDEELPEDRFHREDALSNHYIQQREGDRKEKWRKHEEGDKAPGGQPGERGRRRVHRRGRLQAGRQVRPSCHRPRGEARRVVWHKLYRNRGDAQGKEHRPRGRGEWQRERPGRGRGAG